MVSLQKLKKQRMWQRGGLTAAMLCSLMIPAWWASNAAVMHPQAPEQTASQNVLPYAEQIQALTQKYGVSPSASAELQQRRVAKAILVRNARFHEVPVELVLGISGYESGGWQMWDAQAQPLRSVNRLRNGQVHSSDWGMMQINDLAHPEAFPRAKHDLEYHIGYAVAYLAALHPQAQGSLNLGFGKWDRTLAAYYLGHTPSPAEYPLCNAAPALRHFCSRSGAVSNQLQQTGSKSG